MDSLAEEKKFGVSKIEFDDMKSRKRDERRDDGRIHPIPRGDNSMAK
jgi:hypothetical protein